MFRFSDYVLLCVTFIFAFLCRDLTFPRITNLTKGSRRFAIPISAIVVFLGCVLVAAILHEPVPRVHDEFSYLLMADTLAHGRVSNPPPQHPEFFETFHVLVRPVYVSKYWPGQGVFLAVGEKITGHPAVGVWLSSALACAATIWMLDAWVGSGWAVLGGLLMALQYGLFSYFTQSYWGGMVAALGGSLFFGGMRRAWDQFSVQSSTLAALGLILLANSRPLEGIIAAGPATLLFLHRIWRDRRWNAPNFWTRLMLPSWIVLIFGAFLLGAYNHAITGSAIRSAYMLHEQQYQESPPFIFLHMRPPKNYSSPWIAYFYHVNETELYARQRTPSGLARFASFKLQIWWEFYCGVLLSVSLVLPGILKRSTRWWQLALLAGLVVVALTINLRIPGWHLLFDALALAEIAVLWSVFEDFWPRLAIATCALLLFEMFFLKWSFPHYFAPAACLVLYLQVEGLRRIWEWRPARNPLRQTSTPDAATRDITTPATQSSLMRNVILVLPLACAISLVLRIEQRTHGWKNDAQGPDRNILLLHDWSLQRAALQRWLEQQSGEQLVIVRYSPQHDVREEWVYNEADLRQSKVVWARDLGSERNQVLLDQFQARTVWLLDADDPEPRLVPYASGV